MEEAKTNEKVLSASVSPEWKRLYVNGVTEPKSENSLSLFDEETAFVTDIESVIKIGPKIWWWGGVEVHLLM